MACKKRKSPGKPAKHGFKPTDKPAKKKDFGLNPKKGII